MYLFIQPNQPTWACYGKYIRFALPFASTYNFWGNFDGGFLLDSFRNGSLVRDIFKRAEANNDWTNFGELLESTPRGNYGNMALHFVQREIIPNVKGSLRWNKNSDLTSSDVAKGVVK